MSGRLWVSIVLGLLVAACGWAGARAVRPTGNVLQLEGPSVVTAQTLPSGSVQKKSLDLTEFRPLLLEPSLADVRRLVDEEQYTMAAGELEGVYRKMPDDPVAEARLRYLLGSLRRSGGEDALAKIQFEKAASIEWPLKADAQLSLAELQLKSGLAKEAFETAGRVTGKLHRARAQLVRGRSLEALKKFEEATMTYRSLLSEAEDRNAHLGLARSLLAEAESAEKGEPRRKKAIDASHQAELARLGLSPDEMIAREASALLKRAEASGATSSELSTPLALIHLEGLIESRSFEAAEETSLAIKIPAQPAFSPEQCKFDYLRGKLLAGQRQWGMAADRISASAQNCTSDAQLQASLLFNAGKYSAADARHTKAVKFYEQLETLYPKSTLSDDGRLRAAKSYKDAGLTARFVEQLSSMPEDYPDGDMTMEGVLLLSLYLIERDDWAGASQILERAAALVRKSDSARGHENSGTERYFLARSLQELDQEEKALLEYESIILDDPLSYYMLHAYSRLLEADPKRARAALDRGMERAQNTPFEFPYRPEFDTPEFLRGMELLRVGEIEAGAAALSNLEMAEGADDSLLWGLALLHDRAGDAHTSHQIARGRLSDWLSHYPRGDWESPWMIGFPRPYLAIVEKESRATGVPEWFIYGIMREESTFRPRVVSPANAYGLMQVIEPTARGIGKAANLPYSPVALKTPGVNIAIGSRVLENLGRRFKTNPWLAIAGYNAGPGRPIRWLRERPNVDFDVWVEMIPIRETRRYMKRVLASRAAYAFLYYREEAQTALVLPKRLTVN